MPYRRSASLTPRALKAISFYLRGFEKAEAMRMAGYAETTLDRSPDKFWRSKAVQAEIRERMRKLAAKTDITLGKILDYLQQLLVVHPGDLVDSEGKAVPPTDIPHDVARLLNWKIKNGQVQFEAVDKLKVLETIAKFSGVYEETLKVSLDGDLKAKIAAMRYQLDGQVQIPQASPLPPVQRITADSGAEGEAEEGATQPHGQD